MKHKLRDQIGILFSIIGGLFIAIMVYTFFTIEGNSEDGVVINLAGRQRMLTQKMTKEAIIAANGHSDPIGLQSTAALFDKTLDGLINGNNELPKCETPEVIMQLEKVKDLWQPFYKNIKIIENDPTNKEALAFLINNNVTLLKEMNRAVKLLEIKSRSKLEFVKILAVAIGVLTIVTILFVLFFSKKKIINPIEELVVATKEIANGNLDIKLKHDYNNEFDTLNNSFEELTQSIKEYRQSLLAEKESIERKVEEAVQKAEHEKISLTKSVDRIVKIMDSVAEGDLTVFVDNDDNDSENIKRLIDKFNKVILGFKKIVISVTEAVHATASASTQISSSTEEMSAGAMEQSSQTGEVAAAIEEMSRTVIETAANATASAEASKIATDKANEGAAKLAASKEGMKKIVNATETVGSNISSLANRTEQIGMMAQVIDEIADQTNLLALNAAIEAARAGEQGRGFAVVADEVRKLAERTTKATKEIAETIKAIQEEAKVANNSMQEAGEAVSEGLKLNDEVDTVLSDILESVEEVSQQINQVAAASEEQSATAEQVSSNIESINNVASESAAVVQQIATASEDLNRLTENLSELVEQFRVEEGRNNEVEQSEQYLLS